jgi:hypothetical protein
LKRRSKIVSFRLSDAEYESLKNVSAARGARSVSEFTRSVACGTNENEKFEDTLRTLNQRMELIDNRLETLAEVLKNAANNTTNNAKEEQGK